MLQHGRIIDIILAVQFSLAFNRMVFNNLTSVDVLFWQMILFLNATSHFVYLTTGWE